MAPGHQRVVESALIASVDVMVMTTLVLAKISLHHRHKHLVRAEEQEEGLIRVRAPRENEPPQVKKDGLEDKVVQRCREDTALVSPSTIERSKNRQHARKHYHAPA